MSHATSIYVLTRENQSSNKKNMCNAQYSPTLQYTYKYNTAPATIENFGPKNATTEGAAQLEAAKTQ